MKYDIRNLENEKVGEIDLSSDIFGLPKRADILARMVNFQLAKRRSGNHQTRGISLVRGTTRKPWKQKGTGRARQGSLRSPQFRGGAIIFGPVVRDHAIGLPKKVRRLALKTALSVKVSEGKLIVLDSLELTEVKTKLVFHKLQVLGIKNALFIDGENVQKEFSLSVRNLPNIDVLPQQGLNVYDILKRDTLVLTKAAIESLEQRFK